MRNVAFCLVVLAAASAPGIASAGTRFDGMWQTTVSRAAARDALGYSFRFMSEVKNGAFRGLRGTLGEARSLLIEGTVGDDGSGKLYATGRTGSKEYVPGRDAPRGTEYNYGIAAHFDGTAGTGTRLEGRPCTFQFVKQ